MVTYPRKNPVLALAPVFCLSIFLCCYALSEAATLAHYRFEEGTGTDVTDSVSGLVDGTFQGGGAFSPDTPGPIRTSATNNFSADFSTNGFARMTGTSFIFHSPQAGGAEGNATLEWFMKVPRATGHSSIFWTNGDSGADNNRFNIFWNAFFVPAPNSDRFVEGDWRDAAGVLSNLGAPGYNSGFPISLNQWHHFAIVRTDLGAGSYQWDWYVDGDPIASQQRVTTSPPELPTALSWLICGRSGGPAVRALIDEIRFSDEALVPDQFLLVSVCDPPPPPPQGTIAHYRFEEGSGTNVVDSLSNNVHGSLVGPAAFSADTPGATLQNATNAFSADFTAGGYALMNGVAFLLQAPPFQVCQTSRDATLEWFLKIPASTGHGAIFWSNGASNADANRFNLFWNASPFTAEPDSDRFIDGNFKGSGGEAQIGAPGYNSGSPLSLNEWHHVAIVRRDLRRGNDFNWDWYIDGALSPNHHAMTSAELPNAVSWLIAGRQGGHSLNALIDEVRFSDVALAPCQFLFVKKAKPVHYRFEEGTGTDIVDSISGQVHGRLIDPAIFSADTPGPIRTSATNNFSADFTAGGYALIDAAAFVFHSPCVGGAVGDATLEWFMKVPAPAGHSSIFWTNADNNNDANRFHIFWNAAFPGGPQDPDADRFISGDFESPGGKPEIGAPGHNSGNPLSLNEWHHIAIVRTYLGTGTDFQWKWYIDGVENVTQAAMTSARMPESLTWLIAGRQGNHGISALIDEIRMSLEALTPDQFLFTGTPKGTVAHYRFEEGNGTGVVDSVSNTVHGSLVGPAGFSADTPGATRANDTNNFSADFTSGGYALMNGVAFILHTPPRGGPTQQHATLEWFMKIPAVTASGAIFWTNGDNNADDNRFNLFWNASNLTGAPDSDRFIDGNFRGPGGEAQVGAPDYNSGNPLSLGEWHHVAIVRRDLGTANDFSWDWYIDGALSPNHHATTSAELPNALKWLIAGRQGGHTLNALIDEVRLSDVALAPDQFLFVKRAQPAKPAHYRFEEGTGTDIVDSLSGTVHGTLIDMAQYNFDTPCSVIDGAANNFSIDFTTGGYALMNAAAFVFHSAEAGGAPGDATLEWFMKVPVPEDHSSIFWTNGENNDNTNRFNIFWSADFTGAPDSDRFIDGDYFGPAGGPPGSEVKIGAPGYNSGNPLSLDEWHHIAIVRTYLGTATDFQWKWYIDGVESTAHAATTSAPLPEASTWLIAGRSGGHSLNALIDEVRMSHEALTPDQFLNCAITTKFRRGDAEPNGEINATDAIVILLYAFLGGPPGDCLEALDADADGNINQTDAIVDLYFAFLGGDPPKPPFPGCGSAEVLHFDCNQSTCQ